MFNIYLLHRVDTPNFNAIQKDTFYVYNYNQVAGDNFQVYYNEQAADYVLPQAGAAFGPMETGLTNQQNWEKYGIAIAGAVAPCTDSTSRPGIVGFTCPLPDGTNHPPALNDVPDRTIAVGRGYRTNDEGIRQLQALVGPHVRVVVVPLPHWRGAGDVFHLMSIISPVDRDLAVVYSPLMSVPFRELLLDRGIGLIEVPDEEFETMGANVLALAPRRCLMVDGNPRTRALLEQAGAEVLTYEGHEISVKGGGGPTCLTRPIDRE